MSSPLLLCRRMAAVSINSSWAAPSFRLISPPTSCLHTSSADLSRIKNRATHKTFYHIKKTNKQADDPITASNQAFLEELKLSALTSPPRAVPYPFKQEEEASSSSPLKEEYQSWPRGTWNERSTRTGVIGRKIGVAPLWTKDGIKIMASMVHVDDCHVVKYVPVEEHLKTLGAQKRLRPQVYNRTKAVTRGVLVVGAMSGDPTKFTKDYCGLFTESGVAPKKKLARFPVSDDAVVQPGTKLCAAHFQPGQYVDVIGRGQRRGFQGVMKRWGFAGMPSGKRRGVTKSHRRPGCIGSGRDKGRVWPGQKMPGHVGGNKVRMLGLKVLRIDYEHNVLYLKGPAVPGWPGEIVQLFDCKLDEKRATAAPRFFPTCYEDDLERLMGEVGAEEYDAAVHRFQDPSVVYKDDGKDRQQASKTKAKTAAGKRK